MSSKKSKNKSQKTKSNLVSPNTISSRHLALEDNHLLYSDDLYSVKYTNFSCNCHKGMGGGGKVEEVSESGSFSRLVGGRARP